jgi:hypothetical protein
LTGVVAPDARMIADDIAEPVGARMRKQGLT